ncbi:MAG: 23S rRNA (uracil(1939)-C(5))-methyltransferase RlmD [Rickettsiales bacterium]|nr:23S rRNA (uracil(1939)-C(5))-methyltransferase RlmD [Rickettsiales bacterium]
MNTTQIEISNISNLGKGFSVTEKGKKIFVPKTVTGDVVEVNIVQENSKFTLAEIVKIITPGEHRQKAACEYFAECGGCSLQHLTDEFSKEFKIKQIQDALTRSEFGYGGDIKFVEVGANSRRRARFHVDSENKLGFFKERSHDVVEIDNCLMLTKNLEALIPKLRNLLASLPHNIIAEIYVCEFDNVIDLIIKLQPRIFIDKVADALLKFAQDEQLNLKYKDSKKLIEIFCHRKPQLDISGMKLSVPSESFIQATTTGQQAIIDELLDYVSNNETLNLLDLYCGIGAYGFALSDKVEKNTGIDSLDNLISSISLNAKKNDLSHKINAYKRDLILNPIRVTELKGYDLVIINPPRSGAKTQIKELANSNIKNLIMVSSNLNSFIADSKVLISRGFALKKLTAIDQFYYTAHIELVAIFQKNDEE